MFKISDTAQPVAEADFLDKEAREKLASILNRYDSLLVEVDALDLKLELVLSNESTAGQKSDIDPRLIPSPQTSE